MDLPHPPRLTPGDFEASINSGEIILEVREKGRSRKEGVCQEDTRNNGIHVLNGLFPDTGKPPANVFCDHFSKKPRHLSSSGGVCTTPYLDSIQSTA